MSAALYYQAGHLRPDTDTRGGMRGCRPRKSLHAVFFFFWGNLFVMCRNRSLYLSIVAVIFAIRRRVSSILSGTNIPYVWGDGRRLAKRNYMRISFLKIHLEDCDRKRRRTETFVRSLRKEQTSSGILVHEHCRWNIKAQRRAHLGGVCLAYGAAIQQCV